MKEMTGSGIFACDGENDTSESDATPNSRTGVHMYQQALAGTSHISFGEEESLSPKKPATLSEVAKQRELSRTLESESEAKSKKQLSDAKCKELSGHDIFAAPPEISPRATTVRALALKESIELGEPVSYNPAAGKKSGDQTATKTAKKLRDKKVSDLSGNDIFKVDVPQSSVEKHLSRSKL